MKKITIFTPTYNRAYTIGKLYESLKKQTSMDFEWVIVDDGSKDNTESLIKQWISEKNKFTITYFKKSNGGKHTAINKGLDLAKGEMFLIVDSDDYLTGDAVEKIIQYEKTIKGDKEKFAGIAMNKGYNKNKIVGTTFKGKYIDATSLERKKFNIKGDKAEIFYTNILRKNKFPEFEGEKFVTEALVWNRIAKQGYKIRWFQDVIYICEYLEDGLTAKGNSMFENSPQGLLLFTNEYIENYNLNFFMKLLRYEYYSNAIYKNKELEKAAKDLNINKLTLRLGIYLRKIVETLRKNHIIR